MKKVNFRSILMSFLVAASFASYVFLQTVEVTEPDIQVSETYEEESSSSVFPDIDLIKKVLEIGKMIVPAIPSE